MLSCELCCSFRAVRLLCLILLQQSSFKNPFFLKCSVLVGSGFIFGCLLRCSAQLEGRLATVCLPRLRPAVVWFTLLLQALRFSCGLRHALRQSLSVVVGFLGNGRLCQQWACISVGTGCLGNGWLHQQWACISVGAGCLGNGGCSSPTEHLGPSARGLFEIVVLFVPLGYPKLSVPAIPWPGPLSKSRSVSSPALSSVRLPVQQGTRTSAPCGECWVGPAVATPAADFAGQRYCLASCVSFILGSFPFCGQQRSVWKCSSDSPLHEFNESFNPELFSQCHLESSSTIVF